MDAVARASRSSDKSLSPVAQPSRSARMLCAGRRRLHTVKQSCSAVQSRNVRAKMAALTLHIHMYNRLFRTCRFRFSTQRTPALIGIYYQMNRQYYRVLDTPKINRAGYVSRPAVNKVYYWKYYF
jgi:hypothetical protein